MALIVSREQARKAKDFRAADGYREQLSAIGVSLFDKTKEWKASDGRSGRIPAWSDLEAGETPETLAAAQQAAEVGRDDSEASIRAMIQAREQARAAKDWTQSDKIRDELRAMGVEIFDKEKMWKSSSGSQGCIIGYKGSAITDLEVTALVAKRETARQSGDWGTADLIRTELKQAGCEIDDKGKTWRTSDGRSGLVPAWTGAAASAGAIGATSHFAPKPPAHAAHAASTTTIQTQLLQAALVAAQNPATAARTLQVLQQAAGGGSGGGFGGYAPQSYPAASSMAVNHSRARAPPAPMRGSVSANPDIHRALATMREIKTTGRYASDSEIMHIIQIREQMRQAKDFASADRLRDALRGDLGLELHEKEKRWSTSDGRSGEIPRWDSL